MMKCWICGGEATTGEHLVKASDLRNYFGKITQQSPIYTHTDKKRNIPIGSFKSKKFKSKALICKKCNGSLTQPHDRAWEKLSNYLLNNIPKNNFKRRINLSKIFPGNTKQQLISIQLYFVKLFGCRIHEYKIPIDTASFSQSILNQEEHPEIFLVLCETPTYHKKYSGLSEIQAINDVNKPVWAEWLYTVGHLSVKVVYSANSHKLGRTKKTWQPNTVGKVIKICAL